MVKIQKRLKLWVSRVALFVSLCLPVALWSASALGKEANIKGVKKFSIQVSGSVNEERPSGAFDLSVNITKKSDSFYYVPYISMFLQHSTLLLRDVVDTTDDQAEISGGLLGIKAGVMLPTLIFRIPIYFYSNFAFGKVSVQSDPWFGHPEESLGDRKVHQVNVGIRVVIKKYYLGYNFAKSDLAYIGDLQTAFVGVNF